LSKYLETMRGQRPS